ncbi:hypothetical protein B0J14DRAFT_663275 [Halenospora varia]|nr:hypothetical protein B0J14DRAFT_663275 [Halenospora varia]
MIEFGGIRVKLVIYRTIPGVILINATKTISKWIKLHALNHPNIIGFDDKDSGTGHWLPTTTKATNYSVVTSTRGGQITGFAQVTKPYVLRDGAAKALNESPDVSDSMQNLILQHSSIDMFLKHYLDRNINVDIQNIYRGQAP